MSALDVLPDSIAIPAQAAAELAGARHAAAQSGLIAGQLAQAAMQGTRLALAGAAVELQQVASRQLEQARLALDEVRANVGLAAEDAIGSALEAVSSAQYACREMIAPRMTKAARILEQADSKGGNTALAFIASALATLDQVAAHAEVMAKGTLPKFKEALATSRKVADRSCLPAIEWADTAMASAQAQYGEGVETSLQIARDALALASEWIAMAGSEAIEARLAAAMQDAHGPLGAGMAAFEHLMQFPDAPPGEPAVIEDEPEAPLPEVTDRDRASLLAHYALGHFANVWNAHAEPLAGFGEAWFKRAAGFSREASAEVLAALKDAMRTRELSIELQEHAPLDAVIAAIRQAADALSADRLAATAGPATQALDRFVQTLRDTVATTVQDVDASRRAGATDPHAGESTANLLGERADDLRRSSRTELASLLGELKPLQQAIVAAQAAVDSARQTLDQSAPSLADATRPQVATLARSLDQASEAGRNMIQCLLDAQACMQDAVEGLGAGTAQLDHARNVLAIGAPLSD